MSTLIYKELLVQKRSLRFNLGYVLFLMAVFGLSGGPFSEMAYIMGSVAVAFMFTQTGCAYDDKNKGEVIINSLPLSRRDVVRAKYWSTLLYGAAMLAVMAFIGFGLTRLPVLKLRMIKARDVVVSLSAISLLAAMYYPFFFKLGYIRSKVFTMFMFYLFFFGPSLTLSYAATHPDNPVVRNVSLCLTQTPQELAGLLSLGAALAVLLLSQTISVHFYLRREF